MSLLKSSLIVSAWTGFSRVLGFVRDVVLANKLGASATSDAFFIALTLPNLLRRLFAEGAFNVAFVPLYSSLKERDAQSAQTFANAAVTWLALILLPLILLAEIFMPYLIMALAPGFLANPEKFAETVLLSRWTFPYLLLITGASILGAMCNSVGKFAAYAAVPAFLNVGLVAALVVFPQFGVAPGVAAAVGVPLGGVIQVAVMLWAFRAAGLSLTFVRNVHNPDMQTLWRRILPAALGVGVLQLSFVLDTVLASLLGDEAISYLQYANRFYQLPLALIGTALATVLLPYFAKDIELGALDRANASFQLALRVGLTLALAATAGLVVLAEPLLATLLQHGQFTAAATAATAWAMIGYTVGLPGYIVTKITSTAFFAAGDTKTPLRIGLMTLGINVVANLVLMQFLGHVGIALATALSGWCQAGMQAYLLHKRGQFNVYVPELWADLGKSLLLTAGLVLFLVGWRLLIPYSDVFVLQFIWLFGGIALCVGCFVVGAWHLHLLPEPLVSYVRAKYRRTT